MPHEMFSLRNSMQVALFQRYQVNNDQSLSWKLKAYPQNNRNLHERDIK